MTVIKLPRIDCETVSREIGDFVIDSVRLIGASGCVVGLSGGVDSSTTAALISRAFSVYNQQHEQQLELVGYILPTRINQEADLDDAQKIVATLSIRYEIHSIEWQGHNVWGATAAMLVNLARRMARTGVGV